MDDPFSPEFVLNFRRWQDHCRYVFCITDMLSAVRSAHQQTSKDDKISVLLDLLCGNEEKLTEATNSWCELLVAKLLYSNPSMGKFDIRLHPTVIVLLIPCRHMVSTCLTRYPQPTKLDEILIAIIDFDAAKAIQESLQFFGNWWFVTHLTDLLYHAGAMEIQKKYARMLFVTNCRVGVNLRDQYLVEYAQSLMWNRSFWQIASTYMVASGSKDARSILAEVQIRTNTISLHLVDRTPKSRH